MAFEEIISIRGNDIFTRTVGEGPPLVVLHGGPGAHHDYLLPQFDGLAQQRTLRYYDQRGGGKSAVKHDVDCGWREQVTDLLALLDHWNIDRADIVGYSWGGLLAMLFATEHTDRIERIGLVSPAPSNAAARLEFESRFQARMNSAEILKARTELRNSGLLDRDPETYKRRAFELSIAGYFANIDNAKNLTPFRVTARTQEAAWKSLGEYDIRSRLSELDIPALVLHGLHDPIPLESAEETARLLGAEFILFENSGHVPHVEEEAKFLNTLIPFFSDNA